MENYRRKCFFPPYITLIAPQTPQLENMKNFGRPSQLFVCHKSKFQKKSTKDLERADTRHIVKMRFHRFVIYDDIGFIF